MPIVMGSPLGAYLEAERREARWGDRPTTGPHEPCVTRQVTIVTHMVFRVRVPIVPDSTCGAYPETKRREAKWGPWPEAKAARAPCGKSWTERREAKGWADRPMAGPASHASQTKW